MNNETKSNVAECRSLMTMGADRKRSMPRRRTIILSAMEIAAAGTWSPHIVAAALEQELAALADVAEES